MAISPPGDIVLDVVRAAEPEALAAARAGLQKAGRGAPAADFPGTINAGAAFARSSPMAGSGPTESTESKVYREFEAMVLQTFVEPMLPKAAESVYGAGLSGNMWKSLLAQELGKAMAADGGVGIANSLAKAHYAEGKREVALSGVDTDAGRAAAEEQRMLSQALVQELQRKAVDAFGAARAKPENG